MGLLLEDPPPLAGPFYLVILFGNAAICILSLLPPPTPTWKVFRVGMMTPLILYGFYYLGYLTRPKDWEDSWGSTLFMTSWGIRALELLVFFPAEENVYRLQRTTNINSQNSKDDPAETIIREPIPPPWTLEKLYWSASLWYSLRGIGWNYDCSLPSTSLQYPYSPTTPRKDYLISRVKHYILAILLHDTARSYMNLSPAHSFFTRLSNSPTYTQLGQIQRAVYSIALATRIWFSLEKTHVVMCLVFVSVGGVMRWEGEFWEPWGWPPMFGGLRDIWRYPGLSHMWSKVSRSCLARV
jgi:hypothetical protein